MSPVDYVTWQNYSTLSLILQILIQLQKHSLAIIKLTTSALQRLQYGFCNFISIFGMKREALDEDTKSFIMHFGLHATIINIVTEIEL